MSSSQVIPFSFFCAVVKGMMRYRLDLARIAIVPSAASLPLLFAEAVYQNYSPTGSSAQTTDP